MDELLLTHNMLQGALRLNTPDVRKISCCLKSGKKIKEREGGLGKMLN
jgi:hypothetical protein